MIPTAEQIEFFKACEFGTGDVLLESVAGSGKTTSIVKSLDYIDDLEKILACSFTKLAATQLDSRIKAQGYRNVTSTTLNSVGWGVCRQNVRGCDIDKYKSNNILDMLLYEDQLPEGIDRKKLYNAIAGPVVRLVGLLKSYVVREAGEELAAKVEELALYHSVDVPEGNYPEAVYARDNITNYAIRVYEYGIHCLLKMDFDDQKFFPVWYRWPVPAFDKIIIDECQDCNECDIQFVKLLKSANPKCRTIWVGDRMQAIYLFRGSLLNAMDIIKTDFNCQYLTLSYCFRCADDILEEPKKLNPLIKSPSPNPKGKGTVGQVTTPEFLEQVEVGDFVICRNTAPLIKRCLQLVKAGKAAKVKGREVGRSLLQLIDKIAASIVGFNTFDHASLLEFIEALDLHRTMTVAALEAAKREESATRVQDECEALTHFCTEANNVDSVVRKIGDLFTDDGDDTSVVLLLTGHKSKGLENDRVWFLRPDLCPSPRAKKEHEVESEKRLRYVILTRAALARFHVIPERDELKAVLES